jgi:uncharacterized membrane protein
MAYPFAIYFLLTGRAPGWVGGLLLLWLLLRAWMTRQIFWLLVAISAAVLAGTSLLIGDLFPLRFYPVLVNAILLAVFGISLVRGPTVVETIARLQTPDLSPEAVSYTRRVTQVWCAFFLINGSIALGTSLWASHDGWVLYNGLISYGLIALLFGIEWLIRPKAQDRVARNGRRD